jgi:hypothetical protein
MNMAEINPDLMIAGILFNTVEDTGVTIDLIAERFGEDVAALVNQHLKYLYLGWGEGNRKLIEDMKKTDIGFKLLMMCDTVVKQRKLKRGLFVLGDAEWEKQAVSKASLSTYFSKIQDELYDLQFDSISAPTYWEMVDTFKDLFVNFYYDQENQRMIQVCADGENFVIARTDLQAKPMVGEVPENVIAVSRKYAERIEANWGEEYNQKQRAEDYSFEEYYVAVKNHVRGFLKEASENDLDRLLITNLGYITEHYNSDVERLKNGEITMDIFLTEGPAMTADGLERLVGVEVNICS